MPWRSDLECNATAIEYHFCTRTGRLFVPRGEGADMLACVKLF